MNLTKTSIKRPVTVLMCVLVILVLGFVSFTKLPLDLMPSINYPMAVVYTTYAGAGPEEVENIITLPLTEVLTTVSNVKNVTSQTEEGISMIMLEFEDGTDMNFATLQIREKVDLAKMYLPSDITQPMVMKADPSMLPIMYMSVSGDMSAMELKDYVDSTLKPAIEKAEGVASATVTGGKTREITIELLPEKLSLYNVTMTQISQILQSENLNLPGGVTEYGGKELTIRNSGQFKSVDEIRNLPLMLSNGATIRLSDVAKVIDGTKKEESFARLNGNDAVLISVQKQTTANTVQVVNRIKDAVSKVDTKAEGLETAIIFDQADMVEMAIDAVIQNAILGAILAVLILLLFLKNFKLTMIVATAIPVSIIATFVLIYFSGLTLNMLSLGGLALGVGMLVDNSIVVIENVYRYYTEGHSKIDAAIKGTKEIAGAVTASTLTTVVVFLPIAFMEGFVSQIFKELALTVSFSLLCSLAVSLTVVPAMCAKMLDETLLLKPEERKRKKIVAKAENIVDKFLFWMNNTYQRALTFSISHKKTIIFGSMGLFVASMLLLPFVAKELLPASDEGQISIAVAMPKGTKLTDTDEVTKRVEDIAKKYPDIEKISTNIGGTEATANTSTLTLILVDKSKRKESTSNIAEGIRNEVVSIPGAQINVTEVNSMFGNLNLGSGVSVLITGEDSDMLKQISAQVEKAIAEVPGTREVKSSITKGRPEVTIHVDRDRAAVFGLTGYQVATAVRTAVDGNVVTKLRDGGSEYDVRLKFPDSESDTLEKLQGISITTPRGTTVPLSSLVNMELEEGPSALYRQDRSRAVTVEASIYDRDLGSISADVQKKLSEISLPEGYSFDLGGQYEMMNDAFTSLGLAILLAGLLVYMVMAAQFESLLDPFILMFSIPLAFTGSAILLFIMRLSINIASIIGVIVLVGVVVNNAIVLVDYINQLRAECMERDEAILKAGPTRLRPILMTALTTILGLIPMLFSTAQGAELQTSMAAVIIGGLLTSTLLTLVFIPTLYAAFDGVRQKNKKKRMKRKEKRLSKATL